MGELLAEARIYVEGADAAKEWRNNVRFCRILAATVEAFQLFSPMRASKRRRRWTSESSSSLSTKQPSS